ncbi:MAG: hypothetical protein PHF05_05955 [Candidatus Izemoplasmatales bacterium]|nr:hypothetical protein [Candidatus Izemoplasmatales bacterium]MDD4069977.1 hypothetical protein [Candidatus Izemoplasmatales bacterium]MDY0140040.1 hypothetical protein [Candidatus Izemoplasmatales bacterium]
MKKLYVLFVALITLVVVAGCNGTREFAADGEFTAYLESIHSNTPMVTTVTVTIENDEIVGYYIDARQGNVVHDDKGTAEDASDDTWTYSWKDKTKKELGDDYNMVEFGGAISEWYVQAELIEAYWLENGVDSVTVNDDNVIDNVTGVTIKDGSYRALAAEAVQLAKDGKMQAVYCTSDDLYIATMTVDAKGDFSDLKLDVLQGNPDGDTFAWKDKTKQELGDEYGMAGVGDGYKFEDGAWVASGEKAELEWFEQAKLITDYVEANGWNKDLQAVEARGGSLDGTTLIDDLAGVTIRSQSYYDLLEVLFSKLPE